MEDYLKKMLMPPREMISTNIIDSWKNDEKDEMYKLILNLLEQILPSVTNEQKLYLKKFIKNLDIRGYKGDIQHSFDDCTKSFLVCQFYKSIYNMVENTKVGPPIKSINSTVNSSKYTEPPKNLELKK